MLNPAVGDPVKVLRLLGFEVSNQASNIAEIPPLLCNLATDLRDGIQLTRLASALSFVAPTIIPQASLTLKHKLTRATRESILDWVVYALEGFKSNHSVGALLQHIEAEDIIYGHREKTIYLLWVLVARSDVSKLVNADDLTKEVHRLAPSLATCEVVGSQASHASCEGVLQKWMRAIAVSKGIAICKDNQTLTKPIIEAILNAYEHYLIEPTARSMASLQERLIRLGCSKQFSCLFTDHTVDTNAAGGEFDTIC